MKRPPTPRDDVFDLYWYFAAERQAIFERRLRHEPPPWTRDSILSTFKFCNVYRASDRVSQYLIRSVIYDDATTGSEADRLFQIVAFRLFSKVETWREITAFLGRSPLISDLEDRSFIAALENAKRRRGTLYTGAFILCATDAYDQGGIKHLNHVELLRHMFVRDPITDRLLHAPSLRFVVDALREYPLIGDFMSYQLAVDLNYSPFVNFSENDFTLPGPGALRGIKKAFVSLGEYSPAETVTWMVDHQEEEFRRRGLSFGGLNGRPLHAIDCQGLFCEIDKYCREALPALLSARSRIKARFRPSSEPFELFLPPKWNKAPSLNSRSASVAGDLTATLSR